MSATVAAPSAGLAERIERKEAEIAWLDEMYAGLRDRSLTYRDWDPEMTGLDKTDRAEWEADQALIAARAELKQMTEAAARLGDGG